MAALTYCLFSVGQELFRIGCIFYNSGFSISKCIVYIRQIRKEYLFNRYLNELKYSLNNNNCENNQNINTNLLVANEKKMNRLSSSTFEDNEEIEIIEGYEIDQIPSSDAVFYDFIDPRLVYSSNNLGELKEGVSFMITGKMLINCERFSINFILDTPTRDIALHVNPRLPQNYIVRNCKIKGLWGKEEVKSLFPCCLQRGKNFTIQILITNKEYLISLNGKHFASYHHRLPFTKITCLEIKGDVDNIHIERDIVTSYPKLLKNINEPKIISLPQDDDDDDDPNYQGASTNEWSSKIICGINETSLDMPFYGKLADKLLLGKGLRIDGRVKILPYSFFINLQQGHNIWPHPIIAFHLNPRFANIGGKHVICRNSWYDNKWDQEERTEMRTDFMPGKSFTLYIYCGETGYEIYLNDKLLTEYKYRLKPDIVDTVYLQGDIKLWKIILQNGKPNKPINEFERIKSESFNNYETSHYSNEKQNEEKQ